MNTIIRRLTLSDEAAFKIAFDEFQEPNFQFANGFDPAQSFQNYLNLLTDREDPRKIPADRVPSTFMCAFLGDEIVGRVSIRHGLSEYIKEVGGACWLRRGAQISSEWDCKRDPAAIVELLSRSRVERCFIDL